MDVWRVKNSWGLRCTTQELVHGLHYRGGEVGTSTVRLMKNSVSAADGSSSCESVQLSWEATPTDKPNREKQFDPASRWNLRMINFRAIFEEILAGSTCFKLIVPDFFAFLSVF